MLALDACPALVYHGKHASFVFNKPAPNARAACDARLSTQWRGWAVRGNVDITGAIFDCDGTLLDSMGSWAKVSVALLRDYGVEDCDRAFAETEHLNMDDTCTAWHDQFGIGASGKALYDELYNRMQYEYAHNVQAFPGARAFLQELANAGVPMIIASSTVPSLVHAGLAAHGMDHFFQGSVSLDKVAYGKDHPDIYLEALRELGTEKGTTWVFEDAPFGLATARGAGFPTVGLLNDHDGRDPREVAGSADILVHGYGELSLALINNYERANGAQEGVVNVLIVDGSPQASSPELVRHLAGAADYVIAADRGAHVLRLAGVEPDLFCGDSDSADSADVAWAQVHAHDEIDYPTDKYETDLALAIWCARNEAARRHYGLHLTLTCATGGKPDHALGVVGQLLANADATPRVVEDTVEYRVLAPAGCQSWEFGAEAEGATFSVVALHEGAVVSEAGARWELDHRALPLLGDVGISNIAGTDTVVTCHAGAAVVYLYRSCA